MKSNEISYYKVRAIVHTHLLINFYFLITYGVCKKRKYWFILYLKIERRFPNVNRLDSLKLQKFKEKVYPLIAHCCSSDETKLQTYS